MRGPSTLYTLAGWVLILVLGRARALEAMRMRAMMDFIVVQEKELSRMSFLRRESAQARKASDIVVQLVWTNHVVTILLDESRIPQIQ